MKRPALTLPASLRALQPPEVLRALDAARAPARPRRVAATPVVPSARVEASGAVVLRLDGLRLVNVANAREHWSTRKRRVTREHAAVNAALRGVRLPAGPRWTVTITREGRGLLDDDGLAIAGKGVRDAVAAALGVDDGPRGPVTWLYAQRRAKAYAVEVRVEVCDAR
jgi:hypothetical protein